MLLSLLLLIYYNALTGRVGIIFPKREGGPAAESLPADKVFLKFTRERFC